MRIRTIKPEFFFHDGLHAAEVAEGLPLRLGYIGLWCAADRAGRFKWEPRKLGAQILPYDEGVDFSRVLDALVTRGFLVKYVSQGVEFGCIPSFNRHQVINNKERASEIPAPPSVPAGSDATATRGSHDDHASPQEGKGKEHGREQGKEGNSPPPPEVGRGAPDSPESSGGVQTEAAPEADPRHHAITSQWSGAYCEAHGCSYVSAGGRDGAALKQFLKASSAVTVEEFLTVARQAWERGKTDRYAGRCRSAATIHGLCTAWNDIRMELARPGPDEPRKAAQHPTDVSLEGMRFA